jgi:hypothetical protein
LKKQASKAVLHGFARLKNSREALFGSLAVLPGKDHNKQV